MFFNNKDICILKPLQKITVYNQKPNVLRQITNFGQQWLTIISSTAGGR